VPYGGSALASTSTERNSSPTRLTLDTATLKSDLAAKPAKSATLIDHERLVMTRKAGRSPIRRRRARGIARQMCVGLLA
jgi:hypothetical protein